MKKLIAVAWIVILSSFTTINTSTGTLSGVVINNENGKPIANASILVIQGKVQITQVSTKANGTFSISLAEGSYTLEVSAAGFDLQRLNVFVKANRETKVTPKLVPSKVEVDDAVFLIVEERELSPKKTRAEMHQMAMGMPTTAANYYVSADMAYIEHNTEEYDFINENIFKDALTNPLSTFSVDVDKASYANVRRFLTQNQKPYKDAVRIEELINYFDYNYPQPKNGDPFSVTIEAGKCPWNEKNQLVLVGLKGENLNEKEIPANNLVFLIDVSGSMYPANRLPLLKQAFKYLVDQLRPQDRDRKSVV